MAEKRRRGRPLGKKSNPQFTQISAYITVQTYRRIKVACAEDDIEISEIVQQLLDRWLADRDSQDKPTS